MTSTPLPTKPAPWACHCTAHLIPFYASPSTNLPINLVYPPLEAGTPTFSSPAETGTYRGGLAFAQILRYTDTPVGPYDELAILPGYFTGPDSLKNKDGKSMSKAKDLRITGIWVSSEASTMNGRQNWNVPKHVARFAFTPVPGQKGVTKVEVFPATPAPGERESEVRPFFTAVFHTISYLPRMPFNSKWMGMLGFGSHILQPPLPEGKNKVVEVGTGDWKRSWPGLKTKKARLVWVDMQQGIKEAKQDVDAKATEDEDAQEGSEESTSKEHGREAGFENWWPGMRRWHLGLECQEAILELGEPEIMG